MPNLKSCGKKIKKLYKQKNMYVINQLFVIFLGQNKFSTIMLVVCVKKPKYEVTKLLSILVRFYSVISPLSLCHFMIMY